MLGQAEELADIGKNRWRIFSRIEFCSLNLQVVFLILIIAEIIIDSSSLPTLSATFFVKSKQFKVHCTLRQKEARTGPMWNGPQTPPRMKRLKNKAQPESEADQNSEGTITKGAAAREEGTIEERLVVLQGGAGWCSLCGCGAKWLKANWRRNKCQSSKSKAAAAEENTRPTTRVVGPRRSWLLILLWVTKLWDELFSK